MNSEKNSSQDNRPKGSVMGGGHGGMGAGEKPKNFKATIKKLISYCRPYIFAIIIALIFAAVGTVFTIMGPNKLSDITDLIMKGMMSKIDFDSIIDICTLLVILYGLGTVLSTVQGLIMAAITQKVSKSMRAEISSKINRLPLSYFDRNSNGDILSRVTNDVDTIGQTLNQSVGTLVSAITLLIGSLIMMIDTNLIMTGTAVAASLIGFGFMGFIMSKSQKHFINQQKELGSINGLIEETYSGHIVVKAYNGEAESKKTFEEINDKLYNSAWKAQFLSGLMMPLMGFMGSLGYVAVCVVGGALTFDGKITFGVIIAFSLYVRLFTQPLSQIAQATTSLQSAAAASERVFEFLEQPELPNESDKTTVLSNVKGDIEFKNVKFGYSPDKIIINDFSASAKAGQKIAIVGPTGAGKTTMVNLLMRFYDTNSGNILVDGVSINDITRENVHDLFCMVLQDTWIFEGTIKENIIYSKKNVTDEDVVKACKAVGLHHFISTLPNGYDTVLNDNASLSAGQKQLVTIARAMIENAPMLILDEATSSVDTRTEILIQEAMDKLMVGRTSFVIAHRLSTIKNADLILVMKDGDIIESGNHNELLAKNGFYAELYNSQFEKVS